MALSATLDPRPRPLNPLNVDNDLDAADTGTPPHVNSPEEDALVKLLDSRYQAASAAKTRVNERAFLSLSFYIGDQWRVWNTTGGGYLQDSRDPARPSRAYLAFNLIRPKIKKLEARAFKDDPSVSFRPASASPVDLASATEGRVVTRHLDALHNRAQQSRRLGKLALTTTTCYLKLFWDASKEAAVPEQIGEGGVPIGSVMAPVGEVEEVILDFSRAFPDPLARTPEEWRWFIQAEMRSLEDVKQQYGDIANSLSGEQASGQVGLVESRYNALNSETARNMSGTAAGKRVLVIEMWEKPSKAYPEGRLVTKAGNTMLRNEPWPYTKTDSFPFVPLSYEEGQGTYWGLNAVHDCIGAQRLVNQMMSRALDQMRMGPKLLYPLNAGLPSDCFTETPFEKIPYLPGMGEPKYLEPPRVQPEIFKLIGLAKSFIDDSTGVHEISDGQAPAGVTAGNALGILLESDTTQLGPFLSGIGTLHKQRAEWEVALAAQFYREPRLSLALPDTPPAPPDGPQASQSGPQAAAPQLLMLRALPEGGACRVEVEPGSALPQSPAAKNQQVMDMFEKGLLGDPASPQARALALTMMEVDGGDEIAQKVLAQPQPPQPNPAEVAQIQAAAQQKQLEQQQAAQAAQAEHDQELKIELMRAEAEIETQKQIAILQAERSLPPAISLSGTMDPAAVVDAEKEAGLEGEVPPPPTVSAKPGTAMKTGGPS